MDFVVLTLYDEEVGCIATDEIPLAVGVLLEAVDAELGELPIAIVIHLQPMLTYALQGQHLVEEQRLKVAIYMIGQIMV